MSWMQHKVSFIHRVLQVWIQSFPSPRLVAILKLKSTVCPDYFTLRWRESSWILTFPESISTMWNANSLVQVWTRVAESISNEDIHYTTKTFLIYLYIKPHLMWTQILWIILGLSYKIDRTLVVFQFLLTTEVCIYPTPPLQEKCEFSFSTTGCHTKAKEYILPRLFYSSLDGE